MSRSYITRADIALSAKVWIILGDNNKIHCFHRQFFYPTMCASAFRNVFLLTRYTHVHHASCRAHGKFEMVKQETWWRRCHAVLHLSRSRVSERSISLRCWRASHLLSLPPCRLVLFSWVVNCLPYLWTCVLALTSVLASHDFCPPSPQPPLRVQLHHEQHVPNTYVNYMHKPIINT